MQKYGELDVVLSGDQSEVALPVMPKYRSKGLTFIYNKKGGISYWKTFLKNNIFKIYKEIKGFPVEHYDLVINDFEFITAWACRLKKVSCIGLGHQASFFSKKTPRPASKSWWGELILKYYAPVSHPIGFHFKEYDQNIFKPVIRSEIRAIEPTNLGHYTVYLPAFSDEKVSEVLSNFPQVKWHVFSKNCSESQIRDSIYIKPIENEAFIQSLASCEGVLTSAGFEAPAEALFLGKKLAVIPIKSQYEQYCNAAAMEEIGILVLNDLDEKILRRLHKWVDSPGSEVIEFPDQTREIISQIMDQWVNSRVEQRAIG